MALDNYSKILISIFLITLVFIKQYSSSANGGSDIKPKPPIKVPDNSPTPTPVVIVPELKDNFVYDDLEKAIQLGKIHKRNIIVVFGAEWCPYCRVLKKDSKSLTGLENYIVCFLDIEKKDKNQKHINKYKPKSLPTSILINTKYQEVSRKVGYRKKDYVSWIKSLH